MLLILTSIIYSLDAENWFWRVTFFFFFCGAHFSPFERELRNHHKGALCHCCSSPSRLLCEELPVYLLERQLHVRWSRVFLPPSALLQRLLQEEPSVSLQLPPGLLLLLLCSSSSSCCLLTGGFWETASGPERWQLQTHELVTDGELPLTHRFLSCFSKPPPLPERACGHRRSCRPGPEWPPGSRSGPAGPVGPGCISCDLTCQNTCEKPG